MTKIEKTSRVPRRVPNPKYKPVGYRQISTPKSKRLDKVARELLDAAGGIFKISSDLDTTVRDSVAEGLARIVHAAYDSQALSLCLDLDAFDGFIRSSTEEWFRSRGFAEWFCVGAGNQFQTTLYPIRAMKPVPKTVKDLTK